MQQPAPPRSQGTRDRILAAARTVFSMEGYERATIRLVASNAGINPALVIRYFGSKENLFASAVTFDLRLPDMTKASKGEVGTKLVSHFLDRWDADGASGDLPALLRAGISHPAARERLLAIFQDQLKAAISSVTGPAEAGPRAALVASQMLGLALGRYVLRLPDMVALDAASIALTLGPTIQRYLTQPFGG
ncbi:TetR/AcrR family transcriptional regulator [Sphingomonas sp. UYP23]